MYSEIVMEHFGNPRNAGELAEADGTGVEGTPGEGNYLIMAVQVREGRISCARFQTYGCPAAIAAGSLLSEWVTGMAVSEARGITAAALEARLGGLPLGKQHCAALAIRALGQALVLAEGRERGEGGEDCGGAGDSCAVGAPSA